MEPGAEPIRESSRGRRARKSIPGAPTNNRQICDECGLLFAKTKDYVEHLAVFHDPKEPGRYYCCDLCGQLFHTAEERRLHDADHDAAAIIAQSESSRRVRRDLRTARPALPPALIRPPSPPPSRQPQPVLSNLNQPLRLDIDSAQRQQLLLATISAPATPHSSWSPPLNSQAGGPQAKKSRAGGSAPITPSDLYLNPPPPEPSPKSGSPPKHVMPHEAPAQPSQPQRPGTVSRCPRCSLGFASAWLMLDHTITRHAARLVRLDRKCFDEAMREKRSETYQDLTSCPFCAMPSALPSDVLLHIVQEHRSNTGLYESPDWAHRVVVSAEVVYLSASHDSRELKFKINVTLKVRK